MNGCLRIHDLHEVRAVDDSIELAAVGTQVIAHVPELKSHTGITLRIDVSRVDPRLVIVIIKSGLVAAHIALVEQEESLDLSAITPSDMVPLTTQDRLILAAGEQAAGKTKVQQPCKNDICGISSHIMKLTLIMKLVPGIG